MEYRSVHVQISDFTAKGMEGWFRQNIEGKIHIDLEAGYGIGGKLEELFVLDDNISSYNGGHHIVFKFNNLDDAVKFKLKFY